MTDANAQLQVLFNNHGIATIPLEQKFLLVAKQLALVESSVTHQNFPNYISSRLDIRLTIKDSVIIECFGDVSDTLEDAIEQNLQNFARNSLHIIIVHYKTPQKMSSSTLNSGELMVIHGKYITVIAASNQQEIMMYIYHLNSLCE